ALPISSRRRHTRSLRDWSSDVCSSDLHTSELQSRRDLVCRLLLDWSSDVCRSEEHTSELQPRRDLVCRLLLEKKKGMSGMPGTVELRYPGNKCPAHRHRVGRVPPDVGNPAAADIQPVPVFVLFFFLMMRRPPKSTLFPPQTLFR